MASHSLLLLARVFLTDRSSMRARCPHPVLVWEPPKTLVPPIEITGVRSAEGNVERGDTVAIELIKASAPNAFPFGVTIGHAENNDVVLRHPQVSRFHAYVQQTTRGRHLVDATSRYGTWLDGQKLTPSKAFLLPPRATLRFGGLAVTYLEPEGLAAWLEEKLADSKSQ